MNFQNKKINKYAGIYYYFQYEFSEQENKQIVQIKPTEMFLHFISSSLNIKGL